MLLHQSIWSSHINTLQYRYITLIVSFYLPSPQERYIWSHGLLLVAWAESCCLPCCNPELFHVGWFTNALHYEVLQPGEAKCSETLQGGRVGRRSDRVLGPKGSPASMCWCGTPSLHSQTQGLVAAFLHQCPQDPLCTSRSHSPHILYTYIYFFFWKFFSLM